jgi:hypothetical protein
VDEPQSELKGLVNVVSVEKIQKSDVVIWLSLDGQSFWVGKKGPMRIALNPTAQDLTSTESRHSAPVR